MTATTRRRRAPGDAASRLRRFDWLGVGLPALLAYVPLLLTHRGMVGADTKTYLYLDPGKLMSEAPYLWNSDVGLGSVTHQNIGYLWPTGPFYWFFETIGVPDWVAQRLWLGTVLFAAGMGVRFLLRTIGWGRLPLRQGGVLVATLAYMLSPYVLNYSARISVILLPWSALPWLIALTARALRRGGWRDPALMALIVVTVGGVNATALLLIGLGPLLWLVHAVVIDREATARQALAAAGRILVLVVTTSLWWVAGLWAQGSYGLPVVRYTETYEVIARSSSAPEVLRGLGYWLFYGSDKLGQWIQPSITYTRPLPLAISYLVPLLAILAAALLRWRFRAFFLTLMTVGALAAIASHPWDESSFLGAVFKEVTRTDAGLSLRSTPRAVPLVALGLSVCLGAGVAALGRRRPRLAWPATAVVGVLVVANFPTLWNGQMVDDNLERPEDIPSYWYDVADYLDQTDDGTRALEIPGADFASYRWGNTIDPVTPGLTERQYAARELFLWGSPQAADLQTAFDQRFHEHAMDPEAIAPIARLLGVGDIVLRNDLMYERYRLARPRTMWDLLQRTPGLDPPVPFGPTEPNVAGPDFPLLDEIELATPYDWEHPPAVAVFGVQDRLAPTRVKSLTSPLVLAGNGDGIVDLAGLGGLHPEQALFYSGSFVDDPEALAGVLGEDAELVITDTNRKRARSWNTLRENAGYTEQADEEALTYDPGDQRLEIFPGAQDDSFTVTEQQGGVNVVATSYGTLGTLTINDRAAGAIDGDPLTAWKVGDGSDPVGQRLVITAEDPVTVDHIDVLQPQTGVQTRTITRVRLTFDGGDPLVVDLDETSLAAPGQRVDIGERSLSTLEIEILADSAGPDALQSAQSGVGFAEIGLADLQVREVIRPPVDLLRAVGEDSLEHRLTYVLTRLRSNPGEPVRTDPEVNLVRVVDVPAGRAFGLTGQARLSTQADEEVVDRLLGLPSAAEGGITATSSEYLPGDLTSRAAAAVDGDPTTSWSTPFLGVVGQWLDVASASPVALDRLELQVVTDGRHSVPTRLTVAVDGDPARTQTVEVPTLPDNGPPGSTTAVTVPLEPVAGADVRVTIDDVRPVTTTDWYTEGPILMPAAIAELGLPGVSLPPVPEQIDTGCRTDLVSVDDAAVPLRATGTTAAVLERGPLTLEPCSVDGPTPTLDLARGEHVLAATPGRDSGLDVDRLALVSERGGAAGSLATLRTPTVGSVTTVGVERPGDVTFDISVPASDEVRWLSFGQSWSDGWKARVGDTDLGQPVVIDGYANGWLLDPDQVGEGPFIVRVEWEPQRVVWIGIAVSAIAVALCLAIIVWSYARRGRRTPGPAEDLLASDVEAALRPGHRGLPVDPELASPPWSDPGPRLSERASVRAATVTAAILAGIMILNVPVRPIDLLLALAVPAVAWLAFRSPRGRGMLGLLAVACFAVAAVYIVVSQWRRGERSTFSGIVDPVHTWALMAIYLLFAEGLRDVIVRRRRADELGGDDPSTKET